MTDVSAILDSIDGTLSDCTVSADAMRWRPEGSPPRPSGSVFAVSPGGSLGRVAWHDLAGASIALDRPPGFPAGGMPFRSLAEVSGTFTGEFYPGALERLTEAFTPAQPPAIDLAAAVRGMFEIMSRALRPFFDWLTRMGHDVHLVLFPRKHKRCVTCHPRLKPKPLAVDGHEYRRRQLARRKRRR